MEFNKENKVQYTIGLTQEEARVLFTVLGKCAGNLLDKLLKHPEGHPPILDNLYSAFLDEGISTIEVNDKAYVITVEER